jgi:rod shape-determining protein MreC
MKTRLVIIAILLLILTVLLSRNDERITNTLLGVINPIKQNYQHLKQEVQEKGHSYIFQQESIEKLSQENRILRKRLLEQTHYIQQVRNIYNVLPKLSKLPIHNISISETISYVKLNSFSQIILTKPKGLKNGQLYGLIQGKVVAGIAELRHDQLYGYLTSDEKCRFAVFVGEQDAPGIAMGVKTNEMIIKFIPKWHKIKEGDKVRTSGLDNIFFADIPVGVVSKIEIQSSYKVAHIKTYSDIYHPKTFFLINDAKATLTNNFDSNATNLRPFRAITIVNREVNLSSLRGLDINGTRSHISSIPSRIDQTQEDVIEPDVPQEVTEVPKPKKIKKKKPRKKVKKKKVKKKKPKPKASTMDLF